MTTLQESPGGRTLQVPKAALDEAGLAAGAEVEVTTDGRSITITPTQPLRRTGRYTLEEILADMPDGDPESNTAPPKKATRRRGKYTMDDLVSGTPRDFRPGELDWGPPVGEEVW